MSYDKQILHLKKKYGSPKGDYFTKNWEKTKGITRTDDGLFIHHDYEKYPHLRGLSKKEEAKKYSFDFQKKETLTFCNLLEHLLLHIKIYNINRNENESKRIRYGLFNIINLCDRLYLNEGSSLSWEQNIYETIKGFEDEYNKLLKIIKF